MGGGGDPFVALKSSNRVLKWRQAVTERLWSTEQRWGAAWRNVL